MSTLKGGRAAIDSGVKRQRAARMKALREALFPTQDAAALASGSLIAREKVNQIESGADGLSGEKSARGFAKACAVGVEDLWSYRDGITTLDDLLAVRAMRQKEPLPIHAALAEIQDLRRELAAQREITAARDREIARLSKKTGSRPVDAVVAGTFEAIEHAVRGSSGQESRRGNHADASIKRPPAK